MTDHSLLSFTPTKHSESKTHKATEWQGKKTIQVNDHALPLLTDQHDVMLKITATAICGSDLHLYLNAMPGMKKGDVLGHEFMGVVEEVGSAVTKFKKGDRAVASFELGCGQCVFCKHDQFSSCDTTNPSTQQGDLYGDRTAGFHGYSHLTGGFDGGQAEHARVPFGDLNLIKVPSDLSDNQVLFLSDILATGWHATELGNVHDGDSVAIWGCGPVGILAAQCAHIRGAKQIIMIDNQQYRLDFAKSKLSYLQLLNFDDTKDVVKSLKEMTGHGPDVCIEAVGFHYTKTLADKIQMALMLETDPASMLNEMIMACKKRGRLSIVGVYAATVNGLNIGAFMEKGLSMAAGQTPVQAYWFKLLDLIKEGKLTPEMVITHELPLTEAAHGYKIFNDKTDNCVKVVLKPGMTA